MENNIFKDVVFGVTEDVKNLTTFPTTLPKDKITMTLNGKPFVLPKEIELSKIVLTLLDADSTKCDVTLTFINIDKSSIVEKFSFDYKKTPNQVKVDNLEDEMEKTGDFPPHYGDTPSVEYLKSFSSDLYFATITNISTWGPDEQQVAVICTANVTFGKATGKIITFSYSRI